MSIADGVFHVGFFLTVALIFRNLLVAVVKIIHILVSISGYNTRELIRKANERIPARHAVGQKGFKLRGVFSGIKTSERKFRSVLQNAVFIVRYTLPVRRKKQNQTADNRK